MSDRLGHAERILAIRLDTIDDVIMTAPALTALRAHGAHVTLLTSSVAVPLASLLPGLDDVVALDVPWMVHTGGRRDLRTHRAVLEDLAQLEFDAAVVFTASTQDPICAAYLAYQCRIPRVAAHVRGKMYGLVTDAIPDTDPWPPIRHEVRRQLELTSALGFEMPATGAGISVPQQTTKVSRLVSSMAAKRWCVLHPGASAQSRRYSVAGWSAVIDNLAEFGVSTAIAGGEEELSDITAIVAGCHSAVRRVDGELDLPELASFMAAAPVAVTCNSAAAHVAAAVGTPVVTVYAGASPQHTPYTTRASVLRRHTECAWCLSSTCSSGDPRCIWGIEPDEIVNEVLTWMGHRPSRNPLRRSCARVSV